MIDEIKTVPHVPLSHPFVERLIGTIRREFLDHVLFWNARDLERKLVDSKIRSWGGVITDDLSYNVDYLVLGIEPPLPDALSANEIDPVLIARNVEQKRAYEQYHKLIGQARTLAVPVLNQNRFLALTGHYER